MKPAEIRAMDDAQIESAARRAARRVAQSPVPGGGRQADRDVADSSDSQRHRAHQARFRRNGEIEAGAGVAGRRARPDSARAGEAEGRR